MIPWEHLETAVLPSGEALTLHRRADEYSMRVMSVELMNSRQHGSEERLASLAVARAGSLQAPRVLVGGLGMGFTLRAVLDLLDARAEVTVAELVADVVAWNHDYFGELAGEPLEDPRVRVRVADVGDILRASSAAFDLILLDTDNGPEGTTQDENAWLYEGSGIAAAESALRPGGVLAVWSMFPSDPFTKRLKRAGLDAEVHFVRSRGAKGNRHVIWVARKAVR